MACQRPFLNPQLPFTGRIESGLFEGKSITITGRVLPGAERFHVNLQCGTQGSSDIALHFNPRYNKTTCIVVCNTLQNSTWGSEQRSSQTPLPRGANFVLTFLVNRDSYSVIINGAHFTEYMHRLAVSRVKAFSMDGGVEIESVVFQNPATLFVTEPNLPHQRNRSKNKSPNFASRTTQQHFFGATQATAFCFQAPPPPYCSPQAYAIPYKTIIQGGLHPGKMIMVQGLVNHDADRFHIDLRFNSGIALHFNPRFNQGVVVRNSQLQGRWGPEEQTGGMPFSRGQPFTISIMCDTQCYKIMINGVQMFTYNHRHFLFQQIDILEVDGNVSLSSVMV